MTERRMLVFLTLLCVLCCVLGPSLAYKLNCTYSKTSEGHMYSVSPSSICNENDQADFNWSHNKTVLATRKTRVPGVVTSNVTTVVIDRYVHKIEYEVICEDWEHYPANCSAIEEEIKGDQRREADPTTVKMAVSEVVILVVGLVLAVAVAGGLIYKFRNCGWVKLRGVKETEGTSTVVYVSDGLTQ
ncbi:hypothetical protein JOB18_050089 [Solea senegalensis]|uniref:Uncharacterized protein n=1 Tax=Solea senegalensis TaxID=28829 RepID=A0AAV6SYB5_SOLSE|nr:uncharacterized protein LOC122776914 isoform X2 [Solea senegalensis]KAG7521502.1 hypothetical protein JOB18_050089 [Solea senegalensis]